MRVRALGFRELSLQGKPRESTCGDGRTRMTWRGPRVPQRGPDAPQQIGNKQYQGLVKDAEKQGPSGTSMGT